MNINGMNVKMAKQNSTAVVNSENEATQPYMGYVVDEAGNLTEETVDVVGRMFYPERAASARPLPQTVIDKIEARTLNRLISATGVDENKPRKISAPVSVLFNWVDKEGIFYFVDTPASIIRSSKILDASPDAEGNINIELISVEEYLVRHEFLTKKQLPKGDEKIKIPLVVANNCFRLSLSGKNMVGRLSCSGFMRTDYSKQSDTLIGLRVVETNMPVDAFSGAIESILDGSTSEKVGHITMAFMKTAVLLSFAMGEDLRIAKGQQDGRVQRDYFRYFGMRLAEVYYGKNEFSSSDSSHLFHALIGGVFDLATLGGAYENIPDGRVVKGSGWNIHTMNVRSY